MDEGEVLPSAEDRKAEVNSIGEMSGTARGIGHLNSTLVMQPHTRPHLIGPQLSTMYQSVSNTHKNMTCATGKTLTRVDFGQSLNELQNHFATNETNQSLLQGTYSYDQEVTNLDESDFTDSKLETID